MIDESAAEGIIDWLIDNRAPMVGGGQNIGAACEDLDVFSQAEFDANEWIRLTEGIGGPPGEPHLLAAMRAWKLELPFDADSLVAVNADVGGWTRVVCKQQASAGRAINNQPTQPELQALLLRCANEMQPWINEAWSFYGLLGTWRRRRRRAAG